MRTLDQIFQAMQKVADENMQAVPFRYIPPKEDEDQVWAEIPGNNPIVMAFKDEYGQWKEAW